MKKYLEPSSALKIYYDLKEAYFNLAKRAVGVMAVDYQAFGEAVVSNYNKFTFDSYAFYQIFDISKSEIIWQYGMEKTLGISQNENQFYAYLQRIHPDYLSMFIFWAQLTSEIDYLVADLFPLPELFYHIRIPLLAVDQKFHWYTQNSFVLAQGSNGHYISNFNYFEYAGLYNDKNKNTQLPYITRKNTTSPEAIAILYQAAGAKIKTVFTPTELELIAWYIEENPSKDFKNLRPDTIHEYNSNILKNLKPFIYIDFPTAKMAAKFLSESGVWIPN
jgi:hypothetical protein